MIAAAAPAAATTHVKDIRYWTAPDHTRLVIDCSEAPRYGHHRRTAPERIVVDIQRARFDLPLTPVAVDDGLVRRVRMNRLGNGVAQVVLDLESAAAYEVFVLPGERGRPDRIVIDVARPESAARQQQRAREIEELKRQRKLIVVIDPGHGGDDGGAVGHKLVEKDVCLAIGRKLRDELNRRRGFHALLTRDDDYFVSLRRRTEMARQMHADYFISLHANSCPSPRARGFEVYFLSLHGTEDEAAKAVAQRENAADRVGNMARGDRKNHLELMLMDMLQTADLERSKLLADTMLGRVEAGGELTIRGVKQAGFDVLKTAGMPSILVEIAFISNRRDARLLASTDFQERFARHLAEGFVEHARIDATAILPPGD
ncbi:MAG: N-acetylmuramoyl-L-alanine amidase [Candidatus Eiseniibacteriota bacterium]